MNRYLNNLAAGVVFAILSAAPAFAQPTPIQPSGSGTAGSPYQIDSLANLYWITQNSGSWGSYFVQLTNIDASSSSTWDSDSGFTPIGNGTTKFTGTYDGELHTITGLYIARVTTSYIAMFGYVNGATIENLGLVNENIKGDDGVGGLVGEAASRVSITDCYTTGSVVDSSNYGGGLVGYNIGGHISRCYSAAADTGVAYVGGLVGENDDTVSNCYALGNASITDSIGENVYSGGLAGYNTGVILNSYSIGKVRPVSIGGGGGLVGGLNIGKVRNSFWDETTSGFPSGASNGGTGETDAAMKSVTIYADSGWDFDSTWEFSSNLNNGYPALLWQYAAYPSGSGTSGSPYLISSFGNLLWIAINPGLWHSYFQQTANINADSSSWFYEGVGPMGVPTAAFTGTYDGELHTITGLYINRVTTNYVGMFGYSVGKIENLGLVNENIKGFEWVGGLAGEAAGDSIVNCYTTGSVYDSISQGGGLVGLNYKGNISRCYSAAADSGGSYIGGLVGENDDTVSNCYALGSVSFRINELNAYPGGLVGYNTGVILNSYSIGEVSNPSAGSAGGLVGGFNTSTVRNSFWDETTSGVTASNGGTGETDAAMKTDTTYTDSSWDFTHTWAISGGVNSGYPYLQAIGADQSLAVQATNFIATSSAGSVRLSWSTQSEVDNAGFNVLRENANDKIAQWQMIASYTTDDSLRGLGTSSTGRSYDFTDNKVISGDTYHYRIQSVSTNGVTKDLSTLSVTVDVPKVYALYQNYPNPFNPTTVIGYQLSAVSNVSLKVYDILGREVATLVNGQQNPGVYKVNFEGSRFASGVYFYRIAAVGNDGQRFVSIKKLVLMK